MSEICLAVGLIAVSVGFLCARWEAYDFEKRIRALEDRK